MDAQPPALVWDPGKFEFQRKLGNFVQYFQVNLPTNSYGVPLKIVNPVLIAENMLGCETTDDLPDNVVEQAIIELDFDGGLPVVDGLPLWERFDGEQLDYYNLFKEYREMFYIGGTRSIMKLANTHNISGRNISALSKVYHWQLRCKAYDAYKKMELTRKKQFEIEKLESKHAKAAEVLLEQAMTYLEDHPEQMNPKVALQMVQVAMKAGRVALGLNGDKPGSTDHGPSISIQQTTHAGENVESTTRVDIGGNEAQASADVSYLQSIVHILDKSGALDKAKQAVIDVDFEEVAE